MLYGCKSTYQCECESVPTLLSSALVKVAKVSDISPVFFLRLAPIIALFYQNNKTYNLYEFLPPQGFDPLSLGAVRL